MAILPYAGRGSFFSLTRQSWLSRPTQTADDASRPNPGQATAEGVILGFGWATLIGLREPAVEHGVWRSERAMLRMSLSGILPATALSLMVATGYRTGSLPLHAAECSMLVSLTCLLSLGFVVAAWLYHPPRKVDRLAAVGLVLYVVVAVASDALLFAGDTHEVLKSVVWLLPLIVGGAVLPRWGGWLTAVGCWLLLFTGVTALAYDVSHVHSGVGFFGSWLD